MVQIYIRSTDNVCVLCKSIELYWKKPYFPVKPCAVCALCLNTDDRLTINYYSSVVQLIWKLYSIDWVLEFEIGYILHKNKATHFLNWLLLWAEYRRCKRKYGWRSKLIDSLSVRVFGIIIKEYFYHKTIFIFCLFGFSLCNYTIISLYFTIKRSPADTYYL